MREIIGCLIEVTQASTKDGRHAAAIELAREVARSRGEEFAALARRVLTMIAAMEYVAREAGISRPRGGCDRAGRWYPDADEEASCCRSIRLPSRRFPNSLFRHCLTTRHVAELYGVTADEIRSDIKRIVTPESLPASRLARARVQDVYNVSIPPWFD